MAPRWLQSPNWPERWTVLSPRHPPIGTLTVQALAIMEPENSGQLFQPSWLNVWEAELFRQAQHATGSKQWMLSRFGVEPGECENEALRHASYRDWLNGLNDTCQAALKQLTPQQRFRMRQQRNALIYTDAWGESVPFETKVRSWRDVVSIDLLPRNIARLFNATDFSCKIRGERNGLLMSLLAAQDMLRTDIADNVIICAYYRAFPVLVFSEAASWPKKYIIDRFKVQNTAERLMCLVLNNSPGQALSLSFNHYGLTEEKKPEIRSLAKYLNTQCGSNTDMLLGITPPSYFYRQQQKNLFDLLSYSHCQALADLYSDSGQINPALALKHFQDNISPESHGLLIIFDGYGGTWVMDIWNHQ